jgi:uncharacterized damage-inducible protein DinB
VRRNPVRFKVDTTVSAAELGEKPRPGTGKWCQWVEGLPEAMLSKQVGQPGGGSKTRFEMLLGTKEHEIHHRAQLMVIEQLLAIAPHLTRNRQPPREKAAV